jgi:hypothetical protein
MVCPVRDDATGAPVEPRTQDWRILTANSERLAASRQPVTVDIDAGGGATELARRCRDALLAALFQGKAAARTASCVGHRLAAEP